MTTICIDSRYIGSRPNGIGEVVRGLVDHAPGLAPDLDFLLLRNPSHGGPLSTAANVREVDVPQAANGPGTMWWLSRLVDLDEVDLFHATFNFLPAGIKAPSITTIHDIMWLTNPDWCRTGLRGWIEKTFYSHGIQRALRKSDHITTVSRASLEAISALYPELASRLTATPSGVSARFQPTDVQPGTLGAIGLPDGRRFVLTVGQYAPYKNHEGAIRAFAGAFAAQGDVDMVLIQRQGGGAARLLDLAAQLGVAGRVHMPGTVSDDALVQLYSAAAILLHPSFCEGFGNPVAEAMACGCPVITSNTSAMPEVASDAARLVDPHDDAMISAALRDIVNDAGLTAQMRVAGLARAAQLNWQRFAQANIDLYRKVLASRGCRPVKTVPPKSGRGRPSRMASKVA